MKIIRLVFIITFLFITSANAQKIDSIFAVNSPLHNSTTQAEFPGGFDSLIVFLSKEVTYPKLEKDKKIEGESIVTLEINKVGKVVNAKVVEGKNKNFNAEALRVTNKMPNWLPATKNGKKIKSCFTLPFQFKL